MKNTMCSVYPSIFWGEFAEDSGLEPWRGELGQRPYLQKYFCFVSNDKQTIWFILKQEYIYFSHLY